MKEIIECAASVLIGYLWGKRDERDKQESREALNELENLKQRIKELENEKQKH